MTEAELEAAMDRAAVIAANREYVRSVMRPVFRIERSTGPASAGRSRFGGGPDLPRGTEWPRHVGGPYRFIAQLNFAELGAPTCGLPERGLLTLFAADDESEAVFWNDPGYLRAIFTPDPAHLERVDPPKEVDRGGSAVIRFTAGVDVPHAKDQRTDWPDAALPSALAAWWRGDVTGGSPTGSYLLGYPGVSSLAYDPTPGPAWLSLLTLATDDALDWYWHDGDYLHVAIERERLAQQDFSHLASDAG
jgi:hypothetical protein